MSAVQVTDVVLRSSDGVQFVVKWETLVEQSKLLRSILNQPPEPPETSLVVPLPRVAGRELAWIVEYIEAAHDGLLPELAGDGTSDSPVHPVRDPWRYSFVHVTLNAELRGFASLQLLLRFAAVFKAASFMQVVNLCDFCAHVFAWSIDHAGSLVSPGAVVEALAALPQELVVALLNRCTCDAAHLVELIKRFPDTLVGPVAIADSLWSSLGVLGACRWQLGDDIEAEVLKRRLSHDPSMVLHLSSFTKSDHSRLIGTAFPAIKSLYVDSCCYLGAEDVQVVSQLVHLESLSMANCHTCSADGFAEIGNLQNLTTLDLTGCEQLTNCALAHIAKLPKLVTLNLADCSMIDDSGLECIAELRQLTDLSIRGCSRVTTRGVAKVVDQLLELRRLDVSLCEALGDDCFGYLGRLQMLQHLNISHCNVSNVVFSAIATIPTLQSFECAGCTSITDDAIRMLVYGCPNLTSLNIGFCAKLGDVSVHSIVDSLQGLRCLNIRNTCVTTAGIQLLRRLTSLEDLNIVACSVEEESIGEFARSNPTCAITAKLEESEC